MLRPQRYKKFLTLAKIDYFCQKKNMKKLSLVALLVVLPWASKLQAQFKFAWGLMSYAGAVNKNYTQNFAPHSLGGYIEFGTLIENHFEPGLRLGNLYFISLENISIIANGQVMPYLRYYFLKMPLVRPFVLGSVGLVGNIGVAEKNTTILGDFFVGARIGGGIRLAKYMEIGLNYFYGGQFLAKEKIAQGATKKLDIHSLEFSVAVTFGGNLAEHYHNKNRFN